MYAMIETRPDLAFAISQVSQFSHNPGPQHFTAIKRIFRYIAGTLDYGITYGGNHQDLTIAGYSDASYGDSVTNRRSSSGYIFMLNGGPITWSSKRQTTVALSTTESEYMSLTQAAKEALWLRLLLTELQQINQPNLSVKVRKDNLAAHSVLNATGLITIFGDNKSSIALAQNPEFHQRTKHIDIQHHFIRDEVTNKRVELTFVNTSDMVADALTKPLGPIKFDRFLTLTGLYPAKGQRGGRTLG